MDITNFNLAAVHILGRANFAILRTVIRSRELLFNAKKLQVSRNKINSKRFHHNFKIMLQGNNVLKQTLEIQAENSVGSHGKQLDTIAAGNDEQSRSDEAQSNYGITGGSFPGQKLLQFITEDANHVHAQDTNLGQYENSLMFNVS